jgi:hypothetical protein
MEIIGRPQRQYELRQYCMIGRGRSHPRAYGDVRGGRIRRHVSFMRHANGMVGQIPQPAQIIPQGRSMGAGKYERSGCCTAQTDFPICAGTAEIPPAL